MKDTTQQTKQPLKQSIKQQNKIIVNAIRSEEAKLRSRFTFLAYQNTIGALLLIGSACLMVCLGIMYYLAVIPGWLTVISVAIVASISHELEHDLIHKQYFAKSPFFYNLMMLIVWLMRPNTVNPWFRRQMHLNHHKVSGTKQDLEERLVGNGIKSPFKRLVVISDGLLGLILSHKILKKEVSGFTFSKVFNAAFPLGTCYFIVLYIMTIYHGIDFFVPLNNYTPAVIKPIINVFNFLLIVLVLPNFIRSASLNFVTSSMHYYGGVTGIHQQTHVITSSWFIPVHLFCFNFGKTHTIHHFMPNQPFYIRQWISKKINRVLKEQGVRFNDFESIKNANAYPTLG